MVTKYTILYTVCTVMVMKEIKYEGLCGFISLNCVLYVYLPAPPAAGEICRERDGRGEVETKV
jgi:hypothetical protein